jgi:hypothetical protein
MSFFAASMVEKKGVAIAAPFFYWASSFLPRIETIACL